MRRGLFVVLLLVLCLSGTWAPLPARAHAYYVRSEPAADAILPQAPTRIEILFTEELEPRYSQIAVYDRNRQRVDRGVTHVGSDPRRLVVEVEALPPGTYAVAWKTLSAVDGHRASGAFAFSVVAPGESIDLTTLGQTTAAIQPGPALVRALHYLAASTLLGLILLELIVLPALGPRRAAPGLAAAERRLAVARWLAWAATLVAALLLLVAQTMTAAEVGPLQALGDPLVQMLTTRYGALWLARLAALLVLFALFVLPLALARSDRARRAWLEVAAAFGALYLVLFSLSGHAAAVTLLPALAVAADSVHLVATAAWVGGLVGLVIALPPLLASRDGGERVNLLARLVPRFSLVGLTSVLALALTGLYQAWLHVGSLEGLVATLYGQALLAKLALLVPLLLIAALNLLVIRPRAVALAASTLAGAAEQGRKAPLEPCGLAGRFRRAVGAEAALGAALLVVVGVLTTLPPSRDALPPPGITQTLPADDLTLTLHLTPGLPGPNRFELRVLDAQGQPVAGAEAVELRFAMLDMDMGLATLALADAGGGRYRGQGSALAMAGTWQVTAVVRRPGHDEARAAFTMRLVDAGGASPNAAALPAGSARPIAYALAAAGVLAAIAVSRLARRWAGALPTAAFIGLGFIGAGAYVVVAAPQEIRNPYAPGDSAALARGMAIYQNSCMACHGIQGRGDGPLAASMQPRPADLTLHVNQHDDATLMEWVSNGFPGSAMPAFADTLSEDDRWAVITYIRTLGAPR